MLHIKLREITALETEELENKEFIKVKIYVSGGINPIEKIIPIKDYYNFKEVLGTSKQEYWHTLNDDHINNNVLLEYIVNKSKYKL